MRVVLVNASLEAFPLFAAGVIVAQLSGAEQKAVDILAVSFIGLRLVYGVFIWPIWLP